MPPDRSNLAIRIMLSIVSAIGFAPCLTIVGCGVPVDLAGLTVLDTGPTVPDPVPTVYKLSDISKGILGAVDYADGRFLCVLGQYNQDGWPEVQSLALTDANENLYEIYFDADGLPIQIRENGQVWDINYDQSDPNNIRTATITRDGQSQQIELPPEFNELIQFLTPTGRTIADSGREFNASTMLGIVMVGLALATGVSIPAAAASGLVALHVAVLGAVSGAAGGIMTIKQSLSDTPPTPEEVRQALIFDIIGIAGGVPAVKALVLGAATLADVAGGLGIVATYAGQNAGYSPIQQTVDEALDEAQEVLHNNDSNTTVVSQIDTPMSGDISLYLNETGTYRISISNEWADKVTIHWSTLGIPVTLSSTQGVQTTLTASQTGFVTLFADVFRTDAPTQRLSTAKKDITIADPSDNNDGGTDSLNPFEVVLWKNSDGKTYYPGKDNTPASQLHVSGDSASPTISWAGVDICNLEISSISFSNYRLWGISTPSLDCANNPLTSPVAYGSFPEGTVDTNWPYSPPALSKYDSEGNIIYYKVSGAFGLGQFVELKFKIK